LRHLFTRKTSYFKKEFKEMKVTTMGIGS